MQWKMARIRAAVRHPLRTIAALIAAVTLALTALYWTQLRVSHDKLRAEILVHAEHHAAQIADAVALQAEDLVRGVDLALHHLRHDFLGDRASFDASVRAIRRLYPDDAVVNVSVINAAGYVVYNAIPSAAKVYAGDRDYFRRHAASTDDRLLLGKPVQGRVSGVWVLLFTRKLMHQGRFAGVVLLSLRAEYVSRRLARLARHADDVISLFDLDGAYFSRSTDLRSVLGQSLPRGRPFVGADAPHSGSFRNIAVHDGVSRIYGWRRLEATALVATVGLATAPILAAAEAEIATSLRANRVGTPLILFALALIVGLLLRAERQQRRIDADAESLKIAATAFDAAAEGILVTDARNRILLANPAFTRITGYAIDEVLGKTPGLLASGYHDTDFYLSMKQSLDDRGAWEGEVTNRRKDGQLYVEWLKISVIAKDDPLRRRHVAILSDITRRKEDERLVLDRANFDELTHLPNRHLLIDQLEQALRQAGRNDRRAAVLFVDLDDFKPVNDRLGHQAGDQLLRQVAARMQAALRATDTAARLGGDEFVALLATIRGERDAIRIANKLVASLAAPYQINGEVVRISASIGIAVFPQHGMNAAQLLENADRAMYAAKSAGRRGVRLYATPDGKTEAIAA